MTMVTFFFVICLISCAPAFDGLEVDQITSAGEAVKGTATQLQARAKEIGTLLVTQLEAEANEIAPRNQLNMDQVTSVDTGMQLQVKPRSGSTLVIDPDSAANIKYEKFSRKGVKVTRFRKLFEEDDCPEDVPCVHEARPNNFCVSIGCDLCNMDYDVCVLEGA